MDNLKCNRLTCRSILLDTAVVTTCSHCFCVNCANELFSAAQVCPACEASLTEPDDVVICSLQPSNDYKTSVLSGLSPATILEICGRAMAFWQYQSHQELAFQQAVLKSVNDRAAQLQKHVENVVREANSELGLLQSKVAGLERDLELEKRKGKDMQDQLRDKDKEYTKLKNQYERIKRKALLTPGALGSNAVEGNPITGLMDDVHASKTRHSIPAGLAGLGVSMGQVVEGMEANRVQRTPLRTVGTGFAAPPTNWQSAAQRPSKPVRFQPQGANGNFPRNHAVHQEDTESDSANEVEHMLGGKRQSATGYAGQQQQQQYVRTQSLGVGNSGMAFGRSGIRNALSTGNGGLGGASMGRTQSHPRGPESAPGAKQSGRFRPAGFNR